MRLGGTLLLAAAILAAGGCTADGKLEIRAIASPLAAGAKPVSFRVAEARGQFALGNVALALEILPQGGARGSGKRRRPRRDRCLLRPNGPVRSVAAQLRGRLGAGAGRSCPADGICCLTRSTATRRRGSEGARRDRCAARGGLGAGSGAGTRPMRHPPTTPPRPRCFPCFRPPSPIRSLPRSTPASGFARCPPPRPTPSAWPTCRKAPAWSDCRWARSSWSPPRDRNGGSSKRGRPRASRSPAPPPSARQPPNDPQSASTMPPGSTGWRGATRSYLVGRGWTVATVGDVQLPRARSLIVFPSDRRAAAAKLSSQLGFAMEQRAGVRQVTILLGRDAADLTILKAGGG